MSAEVRAELAAAANTVEGINCHPYYRQSTKPGSAVVQKARVVYPNKFGGIVTWQVLLMLPQDLATAEKFWDEKVPPIMAALSPSMTVTEVVAQQLALDTGAVPIVLIQGTREE